MSRLLASALGAGLLAAAAAALPVSRSTAGEHAPPCVAQWGTYYPSQACIAPDGTLWMMGVYR